MAGHRKGRRHPLSERSSSSELWREVGRLRSRGSSVAATEAEAENTRRVDEANSRVETLARELAAARSEADTEGVTGEQVAGRPSISQLRAVWRRFTKAVYRLPDTRSEEGMRGVHHAAATRLIPDLDTFVFREPRGPIEADARHNVRRVLTMPSQLALLSRPEPWAERLRYDYLAEASRVFYRPAVTAAFDKSSEEGHLDSLGTVNK
jgi:hypothetical protein